MHKIKKLRDNLIIEVGSTYNFEGIDYEVITATVEIISGDFDSLVTSSLVYWLKDIESSEVKLIPESLLKKELPKYNEVIAL